MSPAKASGSPALAPSTSRATSGESAGAPAAGASAVSTSLSAPGFVRSIAPSPGASEGAEIAPVVDHQDADEPGTRRRQGNIDGRLGDVIHEQGRRPQAAARHRRRG